MSWHSFIIFNRNVLSTRKFSFSRRTSAQTFNVLVNEPSVERLAAKYGFTVFTQALKRVGMPMCACTSACAVTSVTIIFDRRLKKALLVGHIRTPKTAGYRSASSDFRAVSQAARVRDDEGVRSFLNLPPSKTVDVRVRPEVVDSAGR